MRTQGDPEDEPDGYVQRRQTDCSITYSELRFSRMNISVDEALRTRGKDAETVIQKEVGQMIEKKVWTPVDIRGLSHVEKARIIRSSMFLKEKFFKELASGEFEKLRLVAGGDQQDKTLYDDLSAPTVGTSCVFTLLCIAAH